MMINTRQLSTAFAVVLLLLNAACAIVPPASDTPAEAATNSDVFELTYQAERAYKQSRWIEAVRLYQQIVERVPNDANAWFRLGNTYAQQGAFERAIHAYETSLNHNTEQPKAWFNLSTAYLLNAQAAMRSAHGRLRAGDPAKALIEARLNSLAALVHGRFEEGVSRTTLR